MNDISTSPSTAVIDSLYRKILWRILPLIVMAYVVSYLDRVNVGFAKLEMSADLGLSSAAYGFGAGIFFLGYFLFEVPSNLILHRVGARIWIARIMVTWGILSGAMAFIGPLASVFGVKPDTAFYVLRFLLGVAEAGFFPGIILYFNYWFTSSIHARVMALLLTAQPVSFILGAPLSGALMTYFADSRYMRGWQWLFVVEALPAVVLGIVIFFYLDNGIDEARWLDASEKTELKHRLSKENATKVDMPLRELVAYPSLWLLSAIYLLLVIGIYGVNFWMPTIVKETGIKSLLDVGFVTAIPYVIGMTIMVLVTRRAERLNKRHSYAGWCAAIAGLGLTASAMFHQSLVVTVITMAIAIGAAMSANALFWSFPGSILKGAAVAAGLAAINGFGNLGGLIGPYVLGYLSDIFGGAYFGLVFLGACMILSGALMAGKLKHLVPGTVKSTPTATQA